MTHVIRNGRRAVPGMLASVLLLAACGGGSGDGGGGGGVPNYSISVSPTAISINGLTGSPSPAQTSVTVTFRGDGVLVGSLPGQSIPAWLSVSAPGQSTSPVTVQVSASVLQAPGTYATTLRFVTGRADGSSATYVDVPVTYQLVAGQQVRADIFGNAPGGTAALSFNGGAPQSLQQIPTVPNILGTLAVGSAYAVTVASHPPAQHCSFPDGSTAVTGTVGTPVTILRVNCNAALAPWAWLGGDDPVRAAVYGTRGVAAAANTPGARRDFAYAGDAAGNLWVFGGYHAGAHRNDLWRYDVVAARWTWVSGSTGMNANGVYGTQGVAAPGNAPGARRSAAAWIDTAGNFWLFGGAGYAASGSQNTTLNDLWMYDVAADTWTWKGGADAGDLAALGTYDTTPSTGNIPGQRREAAVVVDEAGDVWLFGGYGAGATNSFGRMNDLWRFTPSTGVWAWMAGWDHPSNGNERVHGTLGVFDAANHPSTRAGASLWVDTGGDLWMFGGTSWFGFENDLWRFDPATRQWAWMGGADRTNQGTSPSLGTYNVPTSANNYPDSRAYAMRWRDAAGNFWLFGGWGHGPDPIASDDGFLNDLWRFSPSSGAWSWMGGSFVPHMPAVRGTPGVAANTNAPSGRMGSAAWTDGQGRLWLWGGGTSPNVGEGHLEDLWRVAPP